LLAFRSHLFNFCILNLLLDIIRFHAIFFIQPPLFQIHSLLAFVRTS